MRLRFIYIRVGSYLAGIALALAFGAPWAASVGADAVHSLRYRHVTLSSLAAFKFDVKAGSIDDVPAWIRALNGKSISVDGGMIPLDQANEFSSFVLLDYLSLNRELWAPRVQECIVVELTPPKRTCYFAGEIRVDGQLHVEVRKEDGFIVSIFSMTPDRIEALPSTVVNHHAAYAGLSAALFLLAWPRVAEWFIRRRQSRFGLCAECGYDLRATPARCPECGQVPAASRPGAA